MVGLRTNCKHKMACCLASFQSSVQRRKGVGVAKTVSTTKVGVLLCRWNQVVLVWYLSIIKPTLMPVTEYKGDFGYCSEGDVEGMIVI